MADRRLVRVLTLDGVPIGEDDAWTLVDLLLRLGRADDLFAAATIEHGRERPARVAALTSRARTAILGVLDDPPDGLLELRAVLLRDHSDRLAG